MISRDRLREIVLAALDGKYDKPVEWARVERFVMLIAEPIAHAAVEDASDEAHKALSDLMLPTAGRYDSRPRVQAHNKALAVARSYIGGLKDRRRIRIEGSEPLKPAPKWRWRGKKGRNKKGPE